MTLLFNFPRGPINAWKVFHVNGSSNALPQSYCVSISIVFFNSTYNTSHCLLKKGEEANSFFLSRDQLIFPKWDPFTQQFGCHFRKDKLVPGMETPLNFLPFTEYMVFVSCPHFYGCVVSITPSNKVSFDWDKCKDNILPYKSQESFTEPDCVGVSWIVYYPEWGDNMIIR